MAATAEPLERGLKAPDFELPGIDGREWSPQQLRGPRGLLVMFICNHCPYVQAIGERIARDARELREIGIHSVAINSNDTAAYPEDAFELMGPFARRYGFDFPYLFDFSQQVARDYGAVCTPDLFGFNADLELQYRGQLDASRREAVPGARRDLFEAMKQIAATGVGPDEQLPSMGCSIKWREDE